MIFALCLVPLFAAPQEPLHAYRITRVSGAEPAIEVRLRFRGDADGTSELSLTREWGGVTNGGDDLSDLRARPVGGDEDGTWLAVSTLAPHRWSVEHEPGALIELAYRLEANGYQGDTDPSIHRRPIVTEGLFHSIGHFFLVAPDHLDQEATARHRIEWSGFSESSGLACSFGVGPGPHEFEGSGHDLRHAIFMAGDVALMPREVMGGTLWVAVEETDWRFEKEAFADLAAAVVDAERGFFEDFRHPYYLISMLAVGRAQPGSLSLGGTGLIQSFSLAVQPGFDLQPEAGDSGGGGGGYERIVALLAHELFHDWNGRVLRREAPEALCYWMSEGFTDFFSRRLQLRGGFIGAEEYVASLNDSLRELFTSSVSRAPNADILAGFWTDPGLSDLPYRRGDAVAMMVDHALRAHSGGERSLDDWMRDLVARGRRGLRISTDQLLEEIEQQTSSDFAAEVRRVVEDGALPVLDPETFGPCLVLETVEMTPFDLGFDARASQVDSVVVGVRPDGPAFAAGLRDGDALLGWSYQDGESAVPAVFQVRREGRTEEIRFRPGSEPVAVPQFRIGESSQAEACTIL